MKRINSFVKNALRKSLCDKFDGRCAYCQVVVGMKGTIDHYLPQALGGTNARENLRWCCFGCNQEKGDMHPEEWEQRMPLPKPASLSKAQQRAALLSANAQRRSSP